MKRLALSLGLCGALAAGLGVGAPGTRAQSRAQSAALPNPRLFAIPATRFPYHTDFLLDARVESNAKAYLDGVVIYPANWNVLHRVTGWYEDALMKQGGSNPAVDILVSEFRTVAAAQAAHRAELRSESYRPAKSHPTLGDESTEFSSSGLLTQGSKKTRVEDSIIYTRYRNLELDVAVYDSHKPKYHWQGIQRRGALALARQLDAIARRVVPAPPSASPSPSVTGTPEPANTAVPGGSGITPGPGTLKTPELPGPRPTGGPGA